MPHLNRVRRLGRLLTPGLALLTLLALAPAKAAPQAEAPVDLKRIERAFEQIVQRVQDSVVGIRSQRRFAGALPGDSVADAAFDRVVLVNGSGAILSADGLILTNEHVIQGADLIEVSFADGRTANATVVASDARSDLAVLRTPRTGLTPVTICDWSQVTRGQWAIVLGNPFGLGADGSFSVSVGVISNLGRRLPGLGEIDDRLYSDMIQTTAAINPGNSGGPLFDISGRMVGIVTAMHTRAADDEGVGFAIPLTPSKLRAIDSLRQGKGIEYGFVGLTAREPESSERAAASLSERTGAVVQALDADGPAARAGILERDLIVRFNGEVVDGPGRLAQLVGESSIGERARIELFRGSQRTLVSVEIGRRDVDRVSWMRSGAALWRGLRLADLTPHVRERMHVAAEALGVVVIDVYEASPGQRAQIRVGDVIERANKTDVRDLLTFRDATRDQDGVVRLRVQGRGEVDVLP